MDRRRAAGALFALAACVAATAAAPTASNQTALDLYDGTSEGCYYNFQHYGEGDRIMTNEPCLNCTCHNRMLMCYLRVCPFTKPIGQDCTVEKRADQCCPIVTCPDVPVDLLTSTSTTSPAEYGATGVGKLDKYGCSLNGKYFPEGSKVPPMPNKPCEHCYCIRNMTTCVMQECTLHVDGCTPIYHKDVCCPVRYSCDHPEDEIPLLDDMTTTVRPTPGFLLTTTTLSPVTQMSQDCVHDDQIVPDGALIKTEKACEHCYCMKGDIVCVVQECGTPMENEGKNCTSQPPREGQCCPDTYICEGDEVTTDLLSESTTPTLVTEELTTILPPRRVGVEGSGYRNEPDEPFTELPTLETETEGSGYEEVTEVAIDITGTTTKTQEEGEKPTEDSFGYGTSTARTPTLEEIETTEPDKGLNTVPSGIIDEEHPITEKATFPAEMVTEQILVEDNKNDQGLNEDKNDILETTLTPQRTAELEDVYITTEPVLKKEDETVTESELFKPEKPTTETSNIAEQLTTHSEQAASESKSPLDDEYDIKTTVIPLSEVTENGAEEPIDKITTTESIKEAYTTSVSTKPLEEVTINEVEPSKTDVSAAITDRIDTIETTSVDNKENEVEEDIPRIPGEGDCLLNEITYRNNSNVPSTNNCHSSCKCVSSIIKCDPIICSPPPEYMDNCQPTYDSPESCCPTYVCHADETMPPQPHSQMSGTESPTDIPSIECNGDQCEVSKDKVDIDSYEKPAISECGSADCSDLAQSTAHPLKPYSEDCVGIDCQATPQLTCEGEKCGVIDPVIKPVHVVPLCENESDCKVAHPPQPPCEGDACTPKVDCSTDDCSTGITTIPSSESQKPVTCNGDGACQTPQDDSVTCEGDLCRKTDKTETESQLPSGDCKDSDCKGGKPDLEIGTEKPSMTKQPDEEDQLLSSTVRVYEEETVTKSEDHVDVTESALEKQTDILDLQTTSRMPLTEQINEKETSEYTTSKSESFDTESPKASEPPTPESIVEKVTETALDISSTEKIKKDGSITDRQEEADAYTTHSIDVSKESSSTLADKVVTKAPLDTITDVFVSEKTDLPSTVFEENITKLPEEVEVYSKLTESPVTEYQELTTKSIPKVSHETETTNIITEHKIIDSLYTTESHDTVTMIPKEETINETDKQEIVTESPEKQTTTHIDTSTQNDIVDQKIDKEPTPDTRLTTEIPELGSTEQSIITGTEPGPDAITGSHEVNTVLPETGIKEEVTTTSSEISPEKTDTSEHKETEMTTISSDARPTETSVILDKDPQTVDLEKEPTTEEEKQQSTTEAQKLFMDQEKSTTLKTEPQEAFTNAPTKEISEDKTSETESPISESSPETYIIPEHVMTESTTEILEDVISSLATAPHEPSLDSSTEKHDATIETEPIGSDNAGQVTTHTPESHISTEHDIQLDTIVPPIVKESEGNVNEAPETATVSQIDQQTETPISHVTNILDTDAQITTIESEDYATKIPQEEHAQTTEMPELQEPAKVPVDEITEQEPETDIIQSSVPSETEKSVTEPVLLVTESAETATEQPATHILEIITEVPVQDKTQEISTETLDKGTEAPSMVSQDELISEKIPSEPLVPVQKESVTTDLPASDKITTEAAQTITDAMLDIESGASKLPERSGEIEETQTDLPEHTDVDSKPEDGLPQEISTQIPEITDTEINVTPSEQSITDMPVSEKEVIDDSYLSTSIPTKHEEAQGTTESLEDITTKDVSRLSTSIPSKPEETQGTTESSEDITTKDVSHLSTSIPLKHEEAQGTTESSEDITTKDVSRLSTSIPSKPEETQGTTESSEDITTKDVSRLSTSIPSKPEETKGTTESSEDMTTKDVFATTVPEISYIEIPKETESPEVVYLQEHLTENYPPGVEEETTAIPEVIKKEKETTENAKIPEEPYTEHPTDVDEEQTPMSPEQATPETHDTTILPDVTVHQEITSEFEEPAITEIIQQAETEAPESHIKETEYDVSKTPLIPGLQETETSTPQEKHEQAPEDMVTETPQELPISDAKPTEKTDILTSEAQEPGQEKEPLDIFTPTEKINEEATTPIIQQFTTKQTPEITQEILPDVTDKYEELTTQAQQEIITKEPILKTTAIPLLPDEMQTEPQLEIDSDMKHITTEPSQDISESQEGLIPVNVDQENVTKEPEQAVTEDLQVGVTEEQHVIPVKESGETDVKLQSETTTDTIDLVTHKDFQDMTTLEYYEKQKPTDAVTVSQQLLNEEPQITTPESVQKIDIESPQDEILKETQSPQETVTKEPEALDITSMTEHESITKSPILLDDESSKLPTEQTSVPKYEYPETTPFVVELEEHTHKVVEEISTIVPFEQEITTKLAEKDEDKEAAEMTTRRVDLTEEQPTTNADDLSTQDETKVTLSDKHPELSTVSLPSEDLSVMTTPAAPEGERVGDDTSPPTTSKDEIPIEPGNLEPQQTPEVEIPVQTEKASTTEKSLETDTSPETVSHEEETTSATSKATTTIKDEISTQSPAPQDTYSKPEEKPSEILPSTAAPEVPKPGLNDVQPTDDIIPDDESQFPPSGGTSGYGGPEPDYVEEDQAFGPGTCRYGGKVYVSAQQIPRDDPCDFCFCFRSDIICLQQSCPPPIHGCHEEPIQGFCCPRYECPVAMATTLNITTTTTTTTTTLPPHFFAHHYKGDAQRTGCQIKGHTYKVGEVVRASSGPCLHCTCGGDGQMKCDPKACTPEPMLRQMIAAAVSAKRRR